MSRKDLELEQLLLGELPEPRAAMLREALRTDPALAERYQALISSNAQTLSTFPPREVADEVQRRFASRPPAGVPWARWAAGAAALAGLAIAIQSSLVITPQPDQTRIKGLAPVLHVFRERAGAIEELQPGASARPGDRVQLRYASAGAPWGVVLSIDGRGAVTLHHPLEAAASPRLETGPTTLPRALELDDAPLFERFIFVSCQARPDVDWLVNAARVLAQQPAARVEPLPLKPGCSEQTSFVLSKEPQ